MIRLKRAYERPSRSDGERYLVERLWPRGLRKEEAKLAGWLRELAPSAELRQWFHHDPKRWEEFQKRYTAELKSPEKKPLLVELAEKARRQDVTFVYAARDDQHNSAVVLKRMLEQTR